jgi:hypothetical protein
MGMQGSAPPADFSHRGGQVAAPTTDPDSAPGNAGLAPLNGGGAAGIHSESPNPNEGNFIAAPIGGSAQPPR